MSANLDENKPRGVTVDLTQVLAEMPSRLTRVETLIEGLQKGADKLEAGQEKLRIEVRDDLNGLRIEMRWLIGIVILVVGGLIGGLYALILKHLH